MSGTPPSGLESLLGGRGNSPSGMEVAHFIGQTYWLQRLKDFLSLGRHDPQNLRPLPNRDRGALVICAPQTQRLRSEGCQHLQEITDMSAKRGR